LLGLQLTLTTAIAYVLGVAAGILVSAPVVTVLLTRTDPVIPGVDRAFSDYGVTALVGLFGALVAVAVYWSVALVSKRWFQRRTETTAQRFTER
jgi:ABC-type Fe3+ transport system permease subunit